MRTKCVLVLILILCILFCLSACQDTTPVDNIFDDITVPGIGETPKETDSAIATGNQQNPTETRTEAPEETPDTTYNGNAEKTPAATRKPTATKKPTATRKPSVTDKQNTTKPADTVKPDRYTQPYVLYVNRMQNVVTVYTADSKGNAATPIKAMLCSTGRNNSTPTGTFSISEKYTWRPLFGNVYGQYASRFNGNILFHSVPYLKTNKGTLKPGEFNKLGTQASDGCVRLNVQDCKWIYDNCGKGTKVVVYDSADPGPLGKPKGIIIPDDAGWDPTDPDKDNPWKQDGLVMPVTFSGIPSTTVAVQRNGKLPDLYAGITATDGLGRDVTSYMKVAHTLDMCKTGIYNVSYQVTNPSGGVAASATVKYEVVDKTVPTISGLTTAYQIAPSDVEALTRGKLLQGISVLDDGDKLSDSDVQLTLNGQTYMPELLVAGKENRILLQVNDGNGNVTQKTITVTVEAATEPPEETESPEETETPETTETPDETAKPEYTETPINI